ncbi:hypothetical protein ACH44C_02440 [Streptomyces purpureus]
MPFDPTDPDTFYDLDDVLYASDFAVEAPETDRVEQAQVVELNDDDYR